jgi:LytS/YehU family sensor histidine kinase
MSGASIIADVAAGLREAGLDTGNGPLVAVIMPKAIGGNPYDAPGAVAAGVDVTAIVDMFMRHEIDGTSILSGDKKVLCEAGKIVPKVGDAIAITGQAHRIEMVWPLSPAGVDLMYTLQAREV